MYKHKIAAHGGRACSTVWSEQMTVWKISGREAADLQELSTLIDFLRIYDSVDRTATSEPARSNA
jgi:hypothetical protein